MPIKSLTVPAASTSSFCNLATVSSHLSAADAFCDAEYVTTLWRIFFSARRSLTASDEWLPRSPFASSSSSTCDKYTELRGYHADFFRIGPHIKPKGRQLMEGQYENSRELSYDRPISASDILVLKLISVLVFILFSSQNFYFI